MKINTLAGAANPDYFFLYKAGTLCYTNEGV